MKLLEYIEQLFSAYGYLVLLIGLPLDAIALPIPPGNMTLAYTGYLSYKGVLEWFPAAAAAYAGSILGMTVTYWMGYRLGAPLIERYGKWLFVKPKHVERARSYYGKYGNKLLLFSYFIPGIRQFIGYFVGIIHIPFRTFALYAYTGSLLWVMVFISIGYLFGDQWPFILMAVERFLKVFIIAIIALLVVFLLHKRRSRGKKEVCRQEALPSRLPDES
ncbi:DedA family protein [Paenibacillus mendelii]|uniref:DedA family protein n=1 Tax=Paenibacillus mendelii TaxID=206163 RepID=A0ABV6JJ57_9BACL|nr:DedA family protein [Paenibacillus mendelii]MCQ6558408.1 DedA family protein [Paenibacillus mendelii]